MNEERFWRTIEASRLAGSDADNQAQLLVQHLSAGEVADIVAFDAIFTRLMHAAYRADLWGAAFLINGGCSDDGFEYFRSGLIALGRKAYFDALSDPDSLADFGDVEIEHEDMLYVAMRAYESKTGAVDFYERYPPEASPRLRGDLSSWSTGTDIDPKKAKVLFPRLWSMQSE